MMAPLNDSYIFDTILKQYWNYEKMLSYCLKLRTNPDTNNPKLSKINNGKMISSVHCVTGKKIKKRKSKTQASCWADNETEFLWVRSHYWVIFCFSIEEWMQHLTSSYWLGISLCQSWIKVVKIFVLVEHLQKTKQTCKNSKRARQCLFSTRYSLWCAQRSTQKSRFWKSISLQRIFNSK